MTTDQHRPSRRSPVEPETLGKYGRKAVFASSIGYALDGFDLLILSFALGGIMADLHLSTPQAGSLATITLLGAVTGGFVFGLLSDRFGRVRMLTWSVIVFAVFTGLSALAFGFWDLALYRFIAGIGIGGEFGIGMTLAAEAVPARLRARATSYVGVGFQLGVLAAALASPWIIGAFGWRGLFVVGAFPAMFAVVLRKRLHESPKFLEKKAELNSRPSPVRLLLADRRTIRITVAIVVLTTVQNFGYFGIMTWLPSYLSNQFGYGLTKSSMWTAATVLGMLAGVVLFGHLADRIGRRRTFWIFQLSAAASVLVYSQLSSPWALLIGGAVMGACANGMIGGYGALMAELYPTEARATAQNVLFNIGRGLGGLAPVLIALVASANGFPFALGLLSGIYVLAFCAMFVIPERRGAELA
ncbi:MFS transporter [Saccharopolyspora sp. 5N102]|uniref:MFS transporter n=1 Tax=Saccharopolyspora sp. 5N102 TaxID=3375155 RepID=UPI0037BB754A